MTYNGRAGTRGGVGPCLERATGVKGQCETGGVVERQNGAPDLRVVRSLVFPVGLALLLLAGGLLFGPPYVERFEVVERTPAAIDPWRPSAAEVNGGTYRMLDRLPNLLVRFSPFPEEDPERTDGRVVPRAPFLDVPHPAWRKVEPTRSFGDARRRLEAAGQEVTLWSCPFPVPWLLDGEEDDSGPVPDGLDIWVDMRPYRQAGGADLSRLAGGEWTISGGDLFVAVAGAGPGKLRLISPGLQASPIPPPTVWKDRTRSPVVWVWLEEDRRPALYLPPPGVVEDHLEVPPDAELHATLGVIDPFPDSPGDGVRFEATFIEDTDGTEHALFQVSIDPNEPFQRRWHDVTVSLAGLNGRRGVLRLATHTRSTNRLYHALVAGVAIAPRRAQAALPDHNVIVLLFDALRPDQLAAYGGPISMPNLEKLAPAESCRYRAVSTSSWTLPAVTSLLSGLYPSAAGLPDAVPPGVATLDVLPATPTLFEELHDRGWYTFAFLNNPFLKHTSLLDGFDRAVFRLDAPADVVISQAIAALDQVAARWPFAAYLHFMDTHLPYREHTWETQGGKEIVTSRPTEYTERSAVLAWQQTEAVKKRIWELYRGEIRFLDHAMGALHQWLVSRGIAGKTMVIVASDHGEAFWEHGLFEHGEAQVAEVNDVALFICPEQTLSDPFAAASNPVLQHDEGAATTVLASLLDVRPTVLGMLGLEPDPPCQGVDLSSPGGLEEARRRDLSCEGVLYGPPEYALIAPPFKLVRESGSLPVLYDLERDPAEQHDVARSHPDVVTRLLQRREAHEKACARTRAQLAARGGDAGGGGGRIDAATREQLHALGYLQ